MHLIFDNFGIFQVEVHVQDAVLPSVRCTRSEKIILSSIAG